MTTLRTRVNSAFSETEKANRLRSLFLVARDVKRSRYDNWIRNYRIVMNRMSGQNYTSWMPQPRDSEVFPILSNLIAWCTDQNPDVGFVPTADPNSQYHSYINQIASDLNNVMLTNWVVEEYDKHAKLMLWDALLYGTGIVKNVWDNDTCDGQGNAVLRRTDPWAFYVDPHASSLQDAEYMIEVRRMSYEAVERMYPNTAHLLNQDGSDPSGYDEKPSIFYEGGNVPKAPFLGSLPHGSGTWNRSTSQNRYWDPMPGYVVYEFWIRENYRQDDPDLPEGNGKYARSRWRCVVMCNTTILFDELAEDLWDHGMHPYEDFRFDDIGEFYGVSLVDHLAFPQIYINRLLTALQQNAELAGNPIFLEPTNSGLSRVGIINRPGQRLPISSTTGAAGGNLPRWLEPPSMPQQVLDLINFWIERMENTAGITDLQKGKAPAQRSAQNVVSSVQEAAAVRIRSALTNLAWTYRRSFVKLADLIIQNYTEPRTMAILGQDGQTTSLYLSSHHFYDPNDRSGDTPLRFILRVEAGASRATSRQARVQNAEHLMALGCVDDQYVIEEHGVKDAQKILQRLYFKRQHGLMPTAPGARQRAARQS